MCVCVCVFIIGTCHQQFLDQIDSFSSHYHAIFGPNLPIHREIKSMLRFFYLVENFICLFVLFLLQINTHTHTHRGMNLISRVFICDLIQLI